MRKKSLKGMTISLALALSLASLSSFTTVANDANKINIKLLADEDDSVYHIADAEEFYNVIDACNNDSSYSIGKTFVIDNDLDFSAYILSPIKVFFGTIDGNNHKLSNIKLETTNSYSSFGLINNLTKDAKITNLIIQDIYIYALDCNNVGLVGISTGTIENIEMYGSVYGKSNVGSVAGVNKSYIIKEGDETIPTTYGYGVIKNVTNNTCVYGKSNVGGVCGRNNGQIISATNNVSINDMYYSSNTTITNIGGIAGYSTGTIIDSTNNGTIGYSLGQRIGEFIGGIAGLSTGDFYFCKNTASVIGKYYSGGIVGYYGAFSDISESAEDSIDSIYQLIKDYINGTDSEEGFIEDVDFGKHYIAYCSNTLNSGSMIQATKYTGGIAGIIAKTDLECIYNYSIGDCTAVNGSYAGGIAGNLLQGEIKSCYSDGKIKANTYAGGIAGITTGKINYNATTAFIIANDYIGGIAGKANKLAQINSNYSNSILNYKTTSEYHGGILGAYENINDATFLNNDHVKYNYYVGNYGGIKGINMGSYFNDAALMVESSDLISKDSLSTVFNSNFAGDYFIPSTIEDGYPVLKYFTEYDTKLDTIYDEISFSSYFTDNKDSYQSLLDNELIETITIVYKEWNESLGNDFSEDSYEILSYKKFKGTEDIKAEYPDLKYVKIKDDKYYFYGKTNTYIVEWNDVSAEKKNQIIKPTYYDITYSMFYKDDNIDLIIENEFIKYITFEVNKNNNEYKLVFTEGAGNNITYNNLTVKVKVNKNNDNTVYVNGQKVESKIYGSYIVFNLASSNDTFEVVSKTPFPTWAIYTIIGSILVIAIAGGVVAYFVIKKKKNGENEVEPVVDANTDTADTIEEAVVENNQTEEENLEEKE